jgi:hypothetical protein
MVDHVEDWSNVRSPSRARRRLKRGFKQNVVIRSVPKKEVLRMGDTLVMHPSVAVVLRSRMSLLT